MNSNISKPFLERLDQLICFFWLLVNIFLGVAALYLSKNNGFEKNNIKIEDYKSGLEVILFGFLIIYMLYLSLVYLFTGRILVRFNSDVFDGPDVAKYSFLVFGFLIMMLQFKFLK
jgi:hypothetical protein